MLTPLKLTPIAQWVSFNNSFKKCIQSALLSILMFNASSTFAAVFPNAGQTETYNNGDVIDGADPTTSPLTLNNQNTPPFTTMQINSGVLNVQNFNTTSGTINLDASTLVIEMLDANSGINFNSNQTDRTGVIATQNTSTLTIGNNLIFDNNATTSTPGDPNSIAAAALSLSGTNTTIGDNAQFINNNTRAFDGEQFASAAIANGYGSTLSIGDNALFENNQATNGRGSGAIYNFRSSTLKIGKNVIFRNNRTDGGYGGAINNLQFSVDPTQSSVEIGEGAQFINNSSSRGGAINNDGGQLTLLQGTNTTTLFENNVSSVGSNSITFGFDSSTLTIQTTNNENSTNALLDMRDPMLGLISFAEVTINKNDAGVWALGGANNFRGSTQFNLNAGQLYLYASGEANQSTNPPTAAGTLNLDVNNSTSIPATFNLASSASLAAGGTNTINLGTGNIVIGDNATIRGGSQSRSLGGSTPRNELGGNTSLTLTSDNNTQLQGLVNLQALEARDAFTLNANLVDA
ncbi:MAG TPA: hypothetical protein DEO98_04965, partial [Legionellales bacterium]|nr:hypothetical protein [Legionellales bacterium]